MNAAGPLPARDGAAGHVARADGQVGAVLDRVDQRRQHGRVVLEVGVHLDEDVVALLEAPGEAGPVGRAEPGLLGAAQDVDRAVLGAPLLGQVGGAVGAAVVDDEDARRGGVLPDQVEDVSMFSASL